MTFMEAALQYHRWGLKVIPFWKTNDQVGFPNGYAKYRASQSESEVIELFTKHKATGVAMLCTDFIEGIDIDTKNDNTGTLAGDFFESIRGIENIDEHLKGCVIQRTKSGGYHLIYRSRNQGPNQKLSSRPNENNKPLTLIETRGDNGILFVYPTPGYQVISGSFENLTFVDPEVRNQFIDAARGFNTYVADSEDHVAPKGNTDAVLPGHLFNKDNALEDLLERYGWTKLHTRGNFTRMNRPGAKNKKGTDGVIIHKEPFDKFYPWSTNCEFDTGKSYDAFAVYAIKEHNGDFAAAARELRSLGYKDTTPPAKVDPEPPKAVKEEPKVDDLLARVKATRYSFFDPIVEDYAPLSAVIDGEVYPIGSHGMLGALVGIQKSGKSLISQCIVASAVTGKVMLNFKAEKFKDIMYFDTEQSTFWYKKSQRRINELAKYDGDIPGYEAYHLRGFKKSERAKAIDLMLTGRKLDMLIIDGIVDICPNFMDQSASMDTMDMIMEWSARTGALTLCVLHLTKGENANMRGALGTELQNKCDFALEVVKNKEDNSFSVKNRESRFAPFPAFHFFRDSRGLPIWDDPEKGKVDWAEEERNPFAYGYGH